MRDHTKLKAFVLADEIVLLVYRLTMTFPKEEIYGLTSQMRRAALSVPSNIVEGCSRESQCEFRRFIEIALGSAKELRYQYSVAVRLGYVPQPNTFQGETKMLEVEKVLNALVRSLHPNT